MACPLGAKYKWTRRPWLFSWWTWPIAKRHWPRPTWPGFGRWYGAPRPTWSAIQAADGEIGHIEDFVIDDETWAIRHLIIAPLNWWPGKQVLVSPQWIERGSWEESKVFVNLSRETIKQSPAYKRSIPITRGYETRLHQHYEREGYWAEDEHLREIAR
jgi:hypothetical protein